MNDYLSYAGIGSRSTPLHIQRIMTNTAQYLSLKKYVLNSGGASGADEAFEIGATDLFKKIFLPWDGFNKKRANGINYIIPVYNEVLIKKYHPKFSALSDKAKLLMSRNSYQVLGEDLFTPVKFVLCWTEDGKSYRTK